MSDGPSLDTRAAYIEEYSEEAQAALPETRQTASTANTTAKRSKADLPHSRTLRDEFSDSGYSSHTAATLGSGDTSSLDSRVSPQTAQKTSDADIDRGESQRHLKHPSYSRIRSPEKPSSKRDQSVGRRYETSRQKECQCPECLARKAKHAPAVIQTDQPAIADTGAVRQPRPSPVSPLTHQERRPTLQDAERGRPNSGRPQRVPPPNAPRARPMSFHAGMTPQTMYAQPLNYSDRPIASAYGFASPLLPASHPVHQPSYIAPVQSVPTTFLYRRQSQAPVYRPTDEYVPPIRPQSMYYRESTPIAGYMQPAPTVVETRPRQALARTTSQVQRPTNDTKRIVAEDHDARLMPPPPRHPPRGASSSRHEQRPIMRHAATTAAAYSPAREIGRREEGEIAIHTRKPSARERSPPRSRRPSLARSQMTSDEKVAAVLQLERATAGMRLDDNAAPSRRSHRRVSIYGHESLGDLEGSIEAAEAYQAAHSHPHSTGVSPVIPTASDDPLRLTRKKTNSDAASRISGSSRASRDGNDLRSSRRPSSDTKSRETHDGESFAMRIPKGVNVNIQPGLEGRTVSLRHSKDGEGEMELRIGERSGEPPRNTPSSTAGYRPAMIRDRSRRRSSIVENQAVVDTNEPQIEKRSNRMAEQEGTATVLSPRGMDRLELDDGQRRIVRERYTSTSRSRRDSRSAHGSGNEMNFF